MSRKRLRVVGQNRDPAKAPRDTSLRRGVLDWLAAGKELFDLPGVLFHAPEEWGTQPYMSAWDKEIKESNHSSHSRGLTRQQTVIPASA